MAASHRLRACGVLLTGSPLFSAKTTALSMSGYPSYLGPSPAAMSMSLSSSLLKDLFRESDDTPGAWEAKTNV